MKTTIIAIILVAVVMATSCTSVNATITGPSVPCGHRPSQSRVVGGKDVTPGSWPWQARIKRFNGSHWNVHGGGASLILDQWVVTAAHVVFSRPDPKKFKVVLGDHSLSKTDSTEQTYDITEVRIHYNFSTDIDIGNDIALLKLSTKVQYNATVKPICLPSQNQRIAVGTKCFITGWGLLVGPSPAMRRPPYSDILQEASLPIVSNSKCNASMSNLRPIDEKSMICAGLGNKSTISGCYGDSGGPLSCEENGVFVLRGAVSFGDVRCRTSNNQRSVFARVSSYVDWIYKEVNSPPLKFPECQDTHWFCKQWKAKGFCKWRWYQPMLLKYCPVTCGKPKCTQTKKKHIVH